MGISPPSLLASATSVSVSLSSSSSGSIVAAAVTWLRHQAVSLCHSALTCLRGSTVRLTLLALQEKVLFCNFFGFSADLFQIHEWERKAALLLEETFWSYLESALLTQGCPKRSTVHPALQSVSSPPLCSDFPLRIPLACKGQVSRISLPPEFSSAVLWSCSSVPQLTQKLPRQNKRINCELCSLGQPTLRPDQSQLWVYFSFCVFFSFSSWGGLLSLKRIMTD